MSKITFEDCIKVIREIGEKTIEKDGTETFKVISANEFIYIPIKNRIYLRDLSLDMNDLMTKGTTINNCFPFLILDESNFGQLKNMLFDSLMKFVDSYQQMTGLEKELLNKEKDDSKKIKV